MKKHEDYFFQSSTLLNLFKHLFYDFIFTIIAWLLSNNQLYDFIGPNDFTSTGRPNPFLATTTLPSVVTIPFNNNNNNNLVSQPPPSFDTSQTLYLGDIKKPLSGKELNGQELVSANQVLF